MKTKTFFLAAAVAASTNAAAQITIPVAGYIVAVIFTGNNTYAVNQIAMWQLSLNQSTINNANDAQGIIFLVNKMWTQASAVGIPDLAWNENISGIAVPIIAGDRLYLHYAGTSTTVTAQAIVYVAI